MRGCSLYLLSATAWSRRPGSRTRSHADRPNVVLIITDDVGYGDIGSYGAPDIKTPNIDSLAKSGTRLTDFYAAPSCSPTRAALISGRYQQRFRIEVPLGAARGPAGEQGLRPTGRSLPQLLKNNGYRTALIGKWHLGLQARVQPDRPRLRLLLRLQERPASTTTSTPTRTASTTCSRTMSRRTSTATRPICSPSGRSSSSRRTPAGRSSSRWRTTPRTGRFRCPTIRRSRPNNARFVQPQDDPTSTRQDYVAILERADRGVGQILAALERRGLSRNTLVIFTNDNGGEWLSRNAPLFHRKQTVWEGGIRVPAIFRWPGQHSRRQDVGAGRHRDGSHRDDSCRDRLAGAGRGAARRASICCRC